MSVIDTNVIDTHTTQEQQQQQSNSIASLHEESGPKSTDSRIMSLPAEITPKPHTASITVIPRLNTEPTTFEDILNSLGGFGFFQFLCLILILILEIPSAFVSFIPVFVGGTPKEWFCGNQSMSSDEICGCLYETVSAAKIDSIVVEWNLICGSSWVSDFITSVGMLGMLFGNIVACKIADWYGRRYAFLGVTICMAIGHLSSAFAMNPYFYAVCRFLTNCGMSGFLGSSIYAMEFLTPKWRQIPGSLSPWGEGIMLLSLIAYFVTDWRQLTLVTCIPFLLIGIIFPFLPESPRWLIRNRKIKEAHKVICYMSKLNQTKLIDIEILRKVVEIEHQQDQSSTVSATIEEAQKDAKVQRFNYIDFFKDEKLCLPTIYQMTIMCTTAITYYGISFNVRNMNGSIYLIVFLLGLSDAIGYPSALLICNRLGRRTSLAIYMTLGALFLTSLAVLELTIHLSNIPTSVIVLCLLGKFCVAGGRSCARTLVGELYPTAVRSMGSGLGGVGAAVGAVLAPQLAFLGSRWPSIPYFVFAIIAVTGALFSFLLTETMGKPLSDNISEIETANSNNDDSDNCSDTSTIDISNSLAACCCLKRSRKKSIEL